MPYYCKTHLQILDKETASIIPFRFKLGQRLVQQRIARQIKETGRVRLIELKARQLGMSTGTAGRFFRRGHLFPNVKSMIVADQKDKGSVLFETYERFFENIPAELISERKSGMKGTQLVLMNGSQFVVETAGDKKAGRASTVHQLHASEVAFWENAHDVFTALVGGIPKYGSEIIIESTANGKGNFFHQRWEAAAAGESSYIPVFLPWFIDPEYQVRFKLNADEREEFWSTASEWEEEAFKDGIEWEGKHHRLSFEQLMWRRQVIADDYGGDESIFRQEMPATPNEAFLSSGNQFFDVEQLLKYGDKTKNNPYRIRGNFVEGSDGGISVQPSPRGRLRIWQMPGEKFVDEDGNEDEHTPVYVIGVDTAEGIVVGPRTGSLSDPDKERGGRDFSCADVYDVMNHRQVAQLHGRMDPDLLAKQVSYLGYFYSYHDGERFRPALIGVESNHGSGIAALRTLKEEIRYPRLYYQRTVNRAHDRRGTRLGWRTTVETRMLMLDDLKRMVREGSIGICSPQTVSEMESFIEDEKGKPQAEEGTHDDRVITLAISVQIGRIQPRRENHEDLPAVKWSNDPVPEPIYEQDADA